MPWTRETRRGRSASSIGTIAHGVDASTHVSEVSDADRQAWCQWYQDLWSAPGYPAPTVGGVDDTGHLSNVGCSFGWDFWNRGLLPAIPANYCEQNLNRSTRPASVEELTDRVVSIRTGWPSPTGCARYMATDGCADTIVMVNSHDVSEGSGASLDPSTCVARRVDERQRA